MVFASSWKPSRSTPTSAARAASRATAAMLSSRSTLPLNCATPTRGMDLSSFPLDGGARGPAADLVVERCVGLEHHLRVEERRTLRTVEVAEHEARGRLVEPTRGRERRRRRHGGVLPVPTGAGEPV